MERRDVQIVIVVILAGIIGFALAAIFMNDEDDEPVLDTAASVQQTATVTTTTNTQTPTTTAPTTTTETAPDNVPRTKAPDVPTCIQLWNRENNTSPKSFLADLQNRQAVRVNVGSTDQAPQKCLVTLIANDGSAYRFTEGAGQTFPYSPQPSRLRAGDLSADERATHALAEAGGTLTPR